MNKIQMEYIRAKKAWEKAVAEEDWMMVESLEDGLLEAEESLVTWTLDTAAQSGLISTSDIYTLQKHWTMRVEQITALGLRLPA
ncbi:hypothetical protein [Paenibacillus alvei]|uniref:Uncharacterized protein n=1 Tax=Paenibacillus alvei TaxID=44250 RepID=A0A383RE49_PAEAL|nr:hypothetical protein [Paenibacillus alvei]SYX84589.1 conserved protein of unknown function [Paenibacillus alvei]